MKQLNVKRFALFASAAMLTVGSVQGAVTAGDLVLFFQKPGNDNTVYVNLGAATLYRGAATGADAPSVLNIIDIGDTLSAAYGADWASQTGIFAGLGASLTSSTADLVVDGDQYRTVYASKPRTAVGTLGAQNSTTINLAGAGNLTGTATSIAGMTSNFATTLPNLDQGIVGLVLSSIDNANPTSVTGTQSNGFTSISNGVQQRGAATAFGTFGDAGQVEFALDLQRLVPDGTVSSGEIAASSRIGTYEGTVVVGTDGQVSFITGVSPIPEPSGALALGILGTIAGLGYRRRKA